MAKNDRISVPTKDVNGTRWANLSAVFDGSHEIVGETVKKLDEKHSFAGGHRVRLYRFKKNVHWKIPTEINLDISAIEPADTPVAEPQRRHSRRR